MEWFIGEYERAKPIFGKSDRRFHPIERLEAIDVRADAVALTLATRGGKSLYGLVSFPDPEVVRLQWSLAEVPGEHLTEMLVAEPERRPVSVQELDGEVRIDGGGTPLVLTRAPWELRFGAYRSESRDTSLIENVAEGGGWGADGRQDYKAQTYETFALRPNEELWGLGERFLGPGLRGRRLSHFITEPGGTNTTDRVYKSVPLVISSREYGLFLHHSEEATFDLGAGSSASGTILVDAGELDLFIILGKAKEVLRRYTALTGRPPVPPAWSFGVWLSKCMYESRQEVEEKLAEARQHDIGIDVIGLDPMWLLHRNEVNYDFCDFVWNDRDFGPIEEFIGWLHGQDIKLCLWVNPNVLEGSDAYVPERFVGRGEVRDICFPTRAFVDFTGAGGDWWVEEMRRLLAAGVDAFKLDYGELAPLDGTYADGRPARQVHNLYGLLASITAHRAGAPFLWTRSGTAGSQRFPTHWAGDSQSTWAGMAGSLHGALAAAWSGFAFWANDIGGFYDVDLTAEETEPGVYEPRGLRLPETELYIRWMQYGLLCSHSRFHGMLGREPWLFGDKAVEVAKTFIALRRSLLDYLLSCSAEAAESGCPLLRPVALEFPDDPGARTVDSEFLLGPALLVAPILEPGGNADVYVPEGGWTDHFTHERFEGPRWVRFENVPIERMPLLVRDGHEPFASAD